MAGAKRSQNFIWRKIYFSLKHAHFRCPTIGGSEARLTSAALPTGAAVTLEDTSLPYQRGGSEPRRTSAALPMGAVKTLNVPRQPHQWGVVSPEQPAAIPPRWGKVSPSAPLEWERSSPSAEQAATLLLPPVIATFAQHGPQSKTCPRGEGRRMPRGMHRSNARTRLLRLASRRASAQEAMLTPLLHLLEHVRILSRSTLPTHCLYPTGSCLSTT